VEGLAAWAVQAIASWAATRSPSCSVVELQCSGFSKECACTRLIGHEFRAM
jgi:hypothetical protein